jgi:hypothetical protein
LKVVYFIKLRDIVAKFFIAAFKPRLSIQTFAFLHLLLLMRRMSLKLLPDGGGRRVRVAEGNVAGAEGIHHIGRCVVKALGREELARSKDTHDGDIRAAWAAAMRPAALQACAKAVPLARQLDKSASFP